METKRVSLPRADGAVWRVRLGELGEARVRLTGPSSCIFNNENLVKNRDSRGEGEGEGEGEGKTPEGVTADASSPSPQPLMETL